MRSKLASLALLPALVSPLAASGAGTPLAQLLADDAAAGDRLGTSTAVNAVGIAAIGAMGDDLLTGAVYVFDTKTGSQLRKLVASDAGDPMAFGASVGISGTTVVVGAYGKDGVALQSGGAYVFDAVTGAELHQLVPDDGTWFDYFGFSVAVSGTTAVIGTPGDNIDPGLGGIPTEAGWAYLFDTVTGQQLARLDPLDGQAGDFFGHAVAISGNTVLVAAPDHTPGPGQAGAVYVFDATTGLQTGKLTSPNPTPTDSFGSSVAIDGSTALIGDTSGDPGCANCGGVAYLFDASTGAHLRTLIAADTTPMQYSWFGASVAIDGGQALIGAPVDDTGAENSGSAYLFDVATGIQVAKLTPTTAGFNNYFGESVGLGHALAVVGCEFDDEVASNAGAAYVFSTLAPPAPYCTAGASSAGCSATLAGTGVASATASSGFTLSASGVEAQRDGLFFFGTNGRQATSWGNGTSFQCVVPPVTRGGILAGNGTAGLCDGQLGQDLNALWCPSCPKPAKNPGAGATVQAQLWYRDPLNTSNQTTSLSDAIEFSLVP